MKLSPEIAKQMANEMAYGLQLLEDYYSMGIAEADIMRRLHAVKDALRTGKWVPLHPRPADTPIINDGSEQGQINWLHEDIWKV